MPLRQATALLDRPSPVPPVVSIALEPGRVLGLVGSPGLGLTRLGLSMLTEPSRSGTVAVVDVRGWLSPLAAWEVGVDPDRLVTVRCPDRRVWVQVTAALLEGLPAVYAELPRGIRDADLRRLGALVRRRRSVLVLRCMHDRVPSGVFHQRIDAEAVRWDGVDRGHGRLGARSLTVRTSGKANGGIERTTDIEDDGSHAVRVVSGLAPASAGRPTS